MKPAARRFGWLLLLLAALTAPLYAGSYWLSILILIGLYATVATGLSLLMGYGGQVSLSQAAFYGIGAYSSGVLSAKYQLSPWLGILVGLLLSGLVAYLVGIPTLRLTGQYLALATMGFGVIVFIFMQELTTLTGGPSGLTGIPALSIGGFSFNGHDRMYYLVLACLLLVLFIASNLASSKVGRALLALHGSEVAAGAMGVNAPRLKLQMFVLSALFASVAGSLYAHWVLFISPSLFEVLVSVDFVVMAVIGGLGSVWGGLLGAAAFVMLTQLLRAYVPLFVSGASGEIELFFFGVILMLMVLFMPGGIASVPSRLTRRADTGAAPVPASVLAGTTAPEQVQR